MKLGSQTGSMTNHILSRAVVGQPKPDVGMGVTILHWTDREAGTIIEVREINGGWDIVVQEDNAKRVDANGMSESQDYEYSANPEGSKKTFRFENKKAAKGWREVRANERGRYVFIEGGGNGLRIGERDKYHDFSF